MKIRTSFVTNSSSYSSAEIKIDNPVLLKILEKYKDRGAFIYYDWDKKEVDLGDTIGSSERAEKAREIRSDHSYTKKEVKEMIDKLDDTPVALYIYERESAEIFFAPNSIEEVSNDILDAIMHGYVVDRLKNKDEFEACKKEILERAEEINNNYIEVSWDASNESYGEFEPDEGEDTSWSFYYHK